MNCAVKTLAAFVSTIKTGGSDILAHAVALGMHEWATENEQLLSDNTFNFDKDLLSRLIYSVSQAFNDYFTAAKCGMPSESRLNLENSKIKTLTNQHCAIPTEIMVKTLHPKKGEQTETKGAMMH